MMYIRDLSRSYKGNSRLLDRHNGHIDLHLSLLPANRLEIAGLQSVFVSKKLLTCALNIISQGIFVNMSATFFSNSPPGSLF